MTHAANPILPASGRDRGIARRQAFLDAGRTVFLEHGYMAASVNDVVRLAGGSLATLYAQFGSKEGLFLAVVQDQQQRMQRDLTLADVEHLPLEEGLTVIGEHSVQAMLAPENLAFYRVVVSEARKFPELVQRILVSAAEQFRTSLSGYLERQSQAEGRPIADPEGASQYFLTLLRTRHQFNALADPSYTLTDTQVKQHVRDTVAVFLHGVLPR